MPTRKLPITYVQRGRFVNPDGQGGWKDWGEPMAIMPKLRALFTPSEGLYVLDLDGQVNGVANLALLQVLERNRVFPWVDVGCRRAEDAVDALFAGAEAITLNPGHMPMTELEKFADLAEGDFHLAYVAEREGVRGMRDAASLVKEVTSVNATGVVFYEGESPAWSTVEAFAKALEREGVPSTWVSKPRSDWTRRVEASGVMKNLVSWEPVA